jgi:hypothetical protein
MLHLLIEKLKNGLEVLFSRSWNEKYSWLGIKLITTSEIRITCTIDSNDKQVVIDKTAREFDL